MGFLFSLSINKTVSISYTPTANKINIIIEYFHENLNNN